MEEKTDIDKILEVLNTAFEADKAAIHALIVNRVPCNEKLANHPQVVVDENRVTGESMTTVGALGLINGIVSAVTGERVAVQWSVPENGRVHILGFRKYVKVIE